MLKVAGSKQKLNTGKISEKYKILKEIEKEETEEHFCSPGGSELTRVYCKTFVVFSKDKVCENKTLKINIKRAAVKCQ